MNLLDYDFLRRFLAQLVEHVPGAEAGSIVVREGSSYRIAAVHAYPLERLGVVLPSTLTPLTRNLQPTNFSRSELDLMDLQVDPRSRAIMDEYGRSREIQNVLSIPIMIEGEALAVVYLDRFHAAPFSVHAMAIAQERCLELSSYVFTHLQKAGGHDLSTGLMTEALFHRRIHHLVASARQRKAMVGLAQIQIANLNSYRHAHGYRAAESVMKELARRFTAIVYNLNPARLETNRLALAVVVHRQQTFEHTLQRIKQELTALVALEPPMNPQIAIGGCLGYDEPNVLEVKCNDGLQRSLSLGTDIVVIGPNQTECSAESHRQIIESENFVLTQLAAGSFYLVYQPVIDLKTQRIERYEALLRLSSQGMEQGSGEFIERIEGSGVIQVLGDWILGTAIKWAARQQVGVAVNISPYQLSSHLPQTVESLLKTHGLLPEQLTLEITERGLVSNEGLDVLRQLYCQGIKLELDDFGEGQTSLSMLRRLPLTGVKADRHLLSEASGAKFASDNFATTALMSLFKQAQSLGLAVVVEGIETLEQLRFAQQVGIRYGQGYFLGKPNHNALNKAS